MPRFHFLLIISFKAYGTAIPTVAGLPSIGILIINMPPFPR